MINVGDSIAFNKVSLVGNVDFVKKHTSETTKNFPKIKQ